MMEILRGTTEMKALKSKKRVRHAYVGNKTHGYWIWKLRTNICTRFVTFFQIDKKNRCKRHESILIRQLLFGEAYHEKLRLPGPQTGWRTVLQEAKPRHLWWQGIIRTSDPGVRVAMEKRRHENLGRFGLLDIGAYDLGSRISGLLRLSL